MSTVCTSGLSLTFWMFTTCLLYTSLALVANQEGCLVHVAQLLLQAHGTGYLEVGKTVNLSGAEQILVKSCLLYTSLLKQDDYRTYHIGFC